MKYLVRIEKDKVTFRKLKRGSKPLIDIGGRTYAGEEDLFIKDTASLDTFLIYPIDSSQPVTCRGEIADPTMTLAKIQSAKNAASGRKAVLRLDGNKLMAILTVIAIVGGIAYGMIAWGHW